MSFRFESRIGIQAPAERAWKIISDFEHWGDWNPIYPEASGTIGFGETIHWTEKLQGRPERRLAFRVLDWTPGMQLVMRAEEGFMTYRLQYIEIDPLEDIGCILAVGCYFRGWFDEGAAKRLGRPARVGFAAMAEAVKTRAEANAA